MNLVIYPDDCLERISKFVDEFDSSLVSTIKQMFQMLKELRGVGLAAPQVGINKRIIVIDPDNNGDESILALINPRVTWKSKENEIDREGCLSIPNVALYVPRSRAIEVEYQDTTGKTHHTIFSDFSARIVQHEIDHLDGVMMSARAIKTEPSIALSNFPKIAIG